MQQEITKKAISELNFIPAIQFIFEYANINKIFSYVGKDSVILDKNNKDNLPKERKGKTPEEELDIFKKSSETYDLVIIDEDLENRWKWINESFTKTNIIVVHDTENCKCDWSLVKKPKNFIWLDIKTHNPWTSIITNNRDIISKGVSKLNATIRT